MTLKYHAFNPAEDQVSTVKHKSLYNKLLSLLTLSYVLPYKTSAEVWVKGTYALSLVSTLLCSAVVGTPFATRVPANLLPAGTRVPVYWIEFLLATRAGMSPTFWTRGLAYLGLAGTCGLAGPIEELLSFKALITLVRVLASTLKWTQTCELSLDPRVPINSSTSYCYP